jgi:photosystem II stability/assembly factor-like uncharacterized protein
MRKFLILTSISAAILLLSGCSGISNTGSNVPAKKYTIANDIFKSTDGGTTWTAKNQSNEQLSVANPDILNIAINPSDSRNILVGFKSGGYVKSDDGGDTWQKTIFVSEKVYGLAFDPANSKIVYASGIWQGRGKLFKSEDSGEIWKEIFTAATDGPFIVSVTIDNKNSSIIYATTSDNQAMRSDDGGNSWENIYQAASPIIKLALDKDNSDLIYAITLNGQVLRSKGEGANLEDIGKNIKIDNSSSFSINQNYGFLEIDPQNSGWVYLAGQSGIIRSRDAGDNWEKVVVLNDPKSAPVSALAINPKNSQELVYGAGQAAYKSTDGGIHWTTSQFESKKSVSVIRYDPANPQNIYVGFKKL